MRLSDILKQHSGLRDALAECSAQQIAACHLRLEDTKLSTEEIRMEQARTAAWREILKQTLKAKDHEDKHGRRQESARTA